MEWTWALMYFAGAVIGHGILVQLPIETDRVKKFCLMGGACGIGLGTHLLLGGSETVKCVAALVSFGLGCEVYVFVFTLVSASISVRLLLILREKEMTEEEITKANASKQMVARRLAKLQGSGLLNSSCGKLRVTRQGRVLVEGYRLLRRVFNEEKNEGRKGGSCGTRVGHRRSRVCGVCADPDAPGSRASSDSV